MRQVAEILKDIDRFTPEDDNWINLDYLLDELWATDEPKLGIVNMLKVLERFPDEDGGGVLWSIVHGLEHLNDYEQKLLDSLYRTPSEMGVIMIRRIENTGETKIKGKEIKAIYAELLNNLKLSEVVRGHIIEYMND